MSTCSRCGRSGEIEYGSDGQQYCSACLFYGLNKPCWKCRMYLPASELQQYKGQWTCPYCIMDMRDADNKAEEQQIKKPKESVVSYTELCERCGRELRGTVYILNNRKLCKSCVDTEKDNWELVSGKPTGSGERISVTPMIKKKKMGLLSSIISETLYALRLKKRPVENVVVYDTKMPIQYAKPMAETSLLKKESDIPPEIKPLKKDEAKPETEGLMPIKEEKKESKIIPVKQIAAVPMVDKFAKICSHCNENRSSKLQYNEKSIKKMPKQKKRKKSKK